MVAVDFLGALHAVGAFHQALKFAVLVGTPAELLLALHIGAANAVAPARLGPVDGVQRNPVVALLGNLELNLLAVDLAVTVIREEVAEVVRTIQLAVLVVDGSRLLVERVEDGNTAFQRVVPERDLGHQHALVGEHVHRAVDLAAPVGNFQVLEVVIRAAPRLHVGFLAGIVDGAVAVELGYTFPVAVPVLRRPEHLAVLGALPIRVARIVSVIRGRPVEPARGVHGHDVFHVTVGEEPGPDVAVLAADIAIIGKAADGIGHEAVRHTGDAEHALDAVFAPVGHFRRIGTFVILEKARDGGGTGQAFHEVLAEIGQAAVVRELLRDNLVELLALGKKGQTEGAAVQVVHALVQIVVEFATSVGLAGLAAASVKFELGFVPDLDDLRGAVALAPAIAALLADCIAPAKPSRTGKFLGLDFQADLFTQVDAVDILHPAIKVLELVVFGKGNHGHDQTKGKKRFCNVFIHFTEI